MNLEQKTKSKGLTSRKIAAIGLTMAALCTAYNSKEAEAQFPVRTWGPGTTYINYPIRPIGISPIIPYGVPFAPRPIMMPGPIIYHQPVPLIFRPGHREVHISTPRREVHKSVTRGFGYSNVHVDVRRKSPCQQYQPCQSTNTPTLAPTKAAQAPEVLPTPIPEEQKSILNHNTKPQAVGANIINNTYNITNHAGAITNINPGDVKRHNTAVRSKTPKGSISVNDPRLRR